MKIPFAWRIAIRAATQSTFAGSTVLLVRPECDCAEVV